MQFEHMVSMNGFSKKISGGVFRSIRKYLKGKKLLRRIFYYLKKYYLFIYLFFNFKESSEGRRTSQLGNIFQPREATSRAGTMVFCNWYFSVIFLILSCWLLSSFYMIRTRLALESGITQTVSMVRPGDRSLVYLVCWVTRDPRQATRPQRLPS